MELNELLTRIQEITECIYDEDKNLYQQVADIMSGIQMHCSTFIALIPKLNEVGMDINSATVVEQLNHLLDAIERRDSLEIYDSLRYELFDTLSFYAEILKIMNDE